jgi:hypothetical protein
LSDADPDVSGTGTFSKAATITTGGLAVSAATIGVEIKTGGLFFTGGATTHYRFNGHCWRCYVIRW